MAGASLPAVAQTGISDFPKQYTEPHDHSQPGHRRGWAWARRRVVGVPLACGHHSGEAEDAGTGLAALLGASTSGPWWQPRRGGPLSLFSLFPVLELLGSGCPVCGCQAFHVLPVAGLLPATHRATMH